MIYHYYMSKNYNSFQKWRNFQTVQSYNSLSYEEAEEEFTSRIKRFNLFNVMVRKRMKKNEEGGGATKTKGNKKKRPKGLIFLFIKCNICCKLNFF